MKEIKALLMAIIGLIISLAVLYGMYWVIKTVSYQIFYEDMVVDSIKETVIQECIKPEAE